MLVIPSTKHASKRSWSSVAIRPRCRRERVASYIAIDSLYPRDATPMITPAELAERPTNQHSCSSGCATRPRAYVDTIPTVPPAAAPPCARRSAVRCLPRGYSRIVASMWRRGDRRGGVFRNAASTGAHTRDSTKCRPLFAPIYRTILSRLASRTQRVVERSAAAWRTSLWYRLYIELAKRSRATPSSLHSHSSIDTVSPRAKTPVSTTDRFESSTRRSARVAST